MPISPISPSPSIAPAKLASFMVAMRQLDLELHRDYELTFSHNRWNFTYLPLTTAHYAHALTLLETLLNDQPASSA